MRVFLGEIVKYLDNNEIEFNIIGLDSFSKKPTAAPIFNIVDKKDEKKVLILQPNEDVDLFFYQPFGSSFLGIRHKDNYIDLSDKDECRIKANNLEIHTTQSSIDIKIGKISLSVNGSEAEISGPATLTFNVAPGTPGPFIDPLVTPPAIVQGTPWLKVTTNKINLI